MDSQVPPNQMEECLAVGVKKLHELGLLWSADSNEHKLYSLGSPIPLGIGAFGRVHDVRRACGEDTDGQDKKV